MSLDIATCSPEGKITSGCKSLLQMTNILEEKNWKYGLCCFSVSNLCMFHVAWSVNISWVVPYLKNDLGFIMEYETSRIYHRHTEIKTLCLKTNSWFNNDSVTFMTSWTKEPTISWFFLKSTLYLRMNSYKETFEHLLFFLLLEWYCSSFVLKAL